MKTLHKITKQIIAFTAFGVALLLAGCASAPEQRDKPKEEEELGLYGALRKKDGRYYVETICRKTRSPLPEGASKYPECTVNIRKNGSLFFDLATLAPVSTSNATCMVWGQPEGQKPHFACDAYKEIHETSVGLNLLTAPLTAVGAVLNAGTKLPTNVKLDEDAFRREIEIALPTERRLEMIEQEREWRANLPVRKANEQYYAQRAKEAAQLERTARAQAFEDQASKALAEAQQRFVVASSVANKSVGTSVCSPDNRMGYIEQVAGDRIKILIKGRAVAKRDAIYGHGNPLGPFKVDTQGLPFDLSVGPQGMSLELPILDPYYLFKPHSTIRIGGRDGDLIWDDGRQWGACGWQF